MKFRIGHGYDVHKLAEGYDFWLGGIKIPHHKGAVGHSDADVLIHAICDALLGAASLRDIGYHFSDKDPKYKGIDSKILLKEVVRMLHEKGYQIGNVDSVLALQAPKIGKYVDEMKAILAEIMQITPEDVSIKATTTEELGFVGREEGVEAHAVALIYRAE
jgi:2-C-methyl-D-erythritol 2,4-cyclodiphosphate synthase